MINKSKQQSATQKKINLLNPKRLLTKSILIKLRKINLSIIYEFSLSKYISKYLSTQNDNEMKWNTFILFFLIFISFKLVYSIIPW